MTDEDFGNDFEPEITSSVDTEFDAYGQILGTGRSAHYIHREAENEFDIDISEREDYDTERELVAETYNKMSEYASKDNPNYGTLPEGRGELPEDEEMDYALKILERGSGPKDAAVSGMMSLLAERGSVIAEDMTLDLDE